MNANSTFSASSRNGRRRDTRRWLTDTRARAGYPKFDGVSRPAIVCRPNLINNVNQATSLSPRADEKDTPDFDATMLGAAVRIFPLFSLVRADTRRILFSTNEKIVRESCLS